MIFLKMSIMKRFFSSIFWGAFVLSILWSQTVCANGTIIYVDADANGLNNGTSWTDAYTDLQSALTEQAVGNEIWVAEGTYKPTTTTMQQMSFVMIPGINMYGGFAGNETYREHRNWLVNETILSGDIGEVGNIWDNSYHVVIGTVETILDGFTITCGLGYGGGPFGDSGGGMLNENVNPIVSNCKFIENRASWGGGIYNSRCNPTITNCIFANNYADNGGGMYNFESNPLLEKNTFIDNISEEGGGLFNNYESQPILYDCTFERNTASAAGGGVGNLFSSPTIINCKFIDNESDGGGREICNRMTSNPILINCSFTGTSHTVVGEDAMFNFRDSSPTIINCTYSEFGICIGNLDNSNPSLSNCILWGEDLPIGPLIVDSYSVTQVTHSNIQGGWPGEGNIDQDPLFMDSDNGDLRLTAGSPCIEAGDNNSVPADSLDLDGDGNTSEKIPFDIAGRQRIRDGNCDGQTIVDMGSFEFYLIGDLKIDCKVNFPDVAIFAKNWLKTNCSPANNWCSGSDIDRDGDADFADLSEIINNWLEESL